MRLSTGGSSSAGSMPDTEFPRVGVSRACQVAGPVLKSSLLPYISSLRRRRRRTSADRHRRRQPSRRRPRLTTCPAVECAERPHHAAAEERLPALPVAIRLHPDPHDRGSSLVTAKGAERCVLIVENPALRGQSKTTTSLYTGISSSCGARRSRRTASRRRGSCWRGQVLAI
jgi:hypothetical protein